MYIVYLDGVRQALVRQIAVEDHHKCDRQCPRESTTHLDWESMMNVQGNNNNTFIREEWFVLSCS